ncbi:hypothetical protein [Pimelobacter simplex]|uniref:hypothetical protein n=1 Tax=Nocardioides simplex TaxID=2045 RepID=UPI003AAB8B68
MTSSAGPADRSGRIACRCFVVGIAGLPLWWVLGVASLVPLAMVLPLGWDLWRRRRVVVPPGFGWWLLFLGWVLLGLGTLGATAPGAVADGGTGRLMVFGYRFGWYVACTVVLVWLGNTPARLISDRTVHRVVAWIFVVAVAGGVVGLVAPDLEVRTLAEQLLPGGLRGNGFVNTLVSAQASELQQVLGGLPQPRPKAPFPFTNTWGSAISLSLVFLVALLVASRSRWRMLAAPLLAVAAVPIVLSLNRGLWLAVGASCLGLLVLLAVRRHHLALVALVATVVVGGVAATSTPLGATVGERLDHPHSNDRRSQLLVATVDSMTSGSPVVGFGGTRNVQGSFASIAGGATPKCPACGVPPLGTQGQLWLVLFSQGWVGTLFFLAFFVVALRRTWRCRTVDEAVATFAVGIFLLQLSVYDTLGLPMMLMMIAVALAWREQRTGQPLRLPTRRSLVLVACLALLGGGVAAAAPSGGDPRWRSTVTVALTPSPTYLDVGDAAREADNGGVEVRPPAAATVDTEAALLRSERPLVLAAHRVGIAPSALRHAISVAAPPLSTVLNVTLTTPRSDDPVAAARAVADEYLAERTRFLEGRRTDLVARLREELAAIDPTDPAWAASRTYLRAAVDNLTTHRPAAGAVIRVGPATPVGTGHGVRITSGLAVGILTGLAWLRVRRRQWE